jgi:hypothetical protein
MLNRGQSEFLTVEDNIMKKSKGAIFWIPRVICIIAIAFISMFALDAFQPGLSIWKQLQDFFMHMIPSFVLLAILIVSWKWELVGGILFTVVGIVLTPIIFYHNYAMNDSVWMSIGIVCTLTVPFFIAGVLFLIGYKKNKKLAVMLLAFLMITLVAALIVALFMGSGKGETYSVTSELVNAPDEEIRRVYVTAEVEEALMPVFWPSFEHSLVSAFESNGVDTTFELIREVDGSVGTDENIGAPSSDATMHISIEALYRTHTDGYEAIVGTVFEVALTDAKTGERAWHLSGKVDYIAEKFFKSPGWRAHEGIRMEFAWNTTAAIVRTFMVDIKGQRSAPIYTVTEARNRHGQRADTTYAYSIVDRWSCQLNDDKTPADLVAASSVWLKAARSNEGGEDLEAFLEFPIEADTGGDDFTSVLVFADRKTWGAFYYDYPNSPAGEAEKAWGEVATCTGASAWASVELE